MEIDLMTLVDGCRKNDRLSQTKLFNLLSPSMFKMCIPYCTDEDEAEDCMMEGFEKVFENINKFKGETEPSFRCWVKRIILNGCISKYRENNFKRQNIVPIDDETLSIECDERPPSRMEYTELLKMIDNVSEKYGSVFEMKEIFGMDYGEISKLTGKSESSIRSRVCRCKEELREKLNKIYY